MEICPNKNHICFPFQSLLFNNHCQTCVIYIDPPNWTVVTAFEAYQKYTGLLKNNQRSFSYSNINPSSACLMAEKGIL